MVWHKLLMEQFILLIPVATMIIAIDINQAMKLIYTNLLIWKMELSKRL
jgi:hypothetical protein